MSASAAAPAGVKPQSRGWLRASAAILVPAFLCLINGVQLAYFCSPGFALFWTLCAFGFESAVYLTSRGGRAGRLMEPKLTSPEFIARTANLSFWTAAAVALWTTNQPMAWIVATVNGVTAAIHSIFSFRGNLKVMLVRLAIPSLPLVGFLGRVALAELPIGIAVAVIIGVAMCMASIVRYGRFGHVAFVGMRNSLAKVEATRHRLEFAIQSAGDGYFEYDLDHRRYTANATLQNLLGLRNGEMTLAMLSECLHADDAGMVRDSLVALREGRLDAWNHDVRVRVVSGDYRWMQFRARLLREDAGRGVLIGTLVDLTARKTLEADLRAAKDQAVASSQSKSEFLANMSHEIRTPLNGVLGMAQALEQDDLTPAQREKVAVILDSGKSLMALLNDVLDLSKIEAGKLEIAPVPGDFLHTMKRTRQLFQAQADDKGIDLTVRYDSRFPQRLAYDPVRVRQCVSNLISNAIKFTAQGHVEIAISARPATTASGAAAHTVSVEVADTGIGMSGEAMGRLFTVFTQADNSTTRRFGGSGLGLAISRQLARMMGGDITVTSREGQGSIFTLTFLAGEAAPAAQPAARAEAPAVAKRSLRGARVLLTDDNAINRQVIKLFLIPQGCEILEATNGKEALDMIATQPFDVVLLDVHMPVMDGKEAIQRIRAARQSWSSVPVIALTADAMSGDREKYLALGMTDYVSKPVDQRELMAKLHQVLGLAPEPGAAKTGT